MRRPLFAMQRRGVQSVLCRGAVCNRIGQGILSAETSVSEIWKTARGSKEVCVKNGRSCYLSARGFGFHEISRESVLGTIEGTEGNIASRLEIDPGAQAVQTAH